MSTALDIVSIGQAAAYIQQMPSAIAKAAVELDIEPVMRINGIDHYNECDLQRIAESLKTAGQRKPLSSQTISRKQKQ